MKKTILYIWDSDYPWDVRVEKICRSLITEGHVVHIASRNLKRNSVYEEDRGLFIHRMETWKSDSINYSLSFPAFFNPFWKKFLNRIITQYHIDLILVRDLPLAIAGIWAAKRNDIPVVFDMAEDYVSMVWDIWRSKKFQDFNLIVRNPYLAKIVERYTFKHVSHTLVVIEEALRVATRGGAVTEDITIVGNTPVLEMFNVTDCLVDEAQLIKVQSHYSVIYTGGVTRGRGLQTVIDAIPQVAEKIPDFLFVIVGTGYHVDALKEQALRLGVEERLMWVGWVAHNKMYQYVKASKVGIIPHRVTNHVNTTMPNKIFDYMGLGLPIVASDAIPLKRIIEEEKCGVYFKGESSESLAQSLLEIYKSNSDYSENGRNAVFNKYNWSFDEKRLREVIEKLT